MTWPRDSKRRKEKEQAETAAELGPLLVDAAYLTATEDQASGSEMGSNEAPTPALLEPAVPGPVAWKMGLIVTASALCGGIAVVLWNRRLLMRMREAVPFPRSEQQGRLWEDDL